MWVSRDFWHKEIQKTADAISPQRLEQGLGIRITQCREEAPNAYMGYLYRYYNVYRDGEIIFSDIDAPTLGAFFQELAHQLAGMCIDNSPPDEPNPEKIKEQQQE